MLRRTLRSALYILFFCRMEYRNFFYRDTQLIAICLRSYYDSLPQEKTSIVRKIYDSLTEDVEAEEILDGNLLSPAEKEIIRAAIKYILSIHQDDNFPNELERATLSSMLTEPITLPANS